MAINLQAHVGDQAADHPWHPAGAPGTYCGDAFSLSPPPAFEIKSSGNSASTSHSWKIWKQQWENYAAITRLNQQTREYQRALSFHYTGTDWLTLFNGMNFSDEDKEDLQTVIRKFDQLLLEKERE